MTNVVEFPGLDLSFELNKIALSVAGINIHWYAVFIVIGIALGIFLCRKSAEELDIKYEALIEGLVVGLFAGIIGARLFYVVFHLPEYLENPITIINFRDGGLSIIGGLLVGGYFLLGRCRNMRLKPEEYFDCMVPYVALAQAIGRWGNFVNVEAYGTACTNFLRMRIPTGEEVHPLFLYESICTLVIFAILRLLQNKRKFKGEITYLYIILYAIVRMIIEQYRVDALMFFGFRVSSVVCFIALIYFGYKYIKEMYAYINLKINEKKLHKDRRDFTNKD